MTARDISFRKPCAVIDRVYKGPEAGQEGNVTPLR